MAHKQGVPITEVAESGPGLAFIAYPQAVAMMPLPQVWSICFFVMIILLGLDTQFVGMEMVMTSVTDVFPTVMRRSVRREGFLLLFCLTCFLSQLLMMTEGGMYVFQIFDYYACNGACLLFLCVFESLALGWIFGAERLYGIIADITGKRPNAYFKICWLYLTPLVSLGSLIYSVVEYKPLKFNRWYVYPTWAYVLGWMSALSSILLVPGCALYKLSTATGTLSQGMWRKKRQSVIEERGHWSSKVEYLLAIAGNIVGLGNVWRFPYLCYKNGGGAFLVPYLVFVVTCGVPLFLLETAMGQHTQEGAITCWRKLCPLAEGIGYGGQLAQFYSCMTYMIIMASTIFYLAFSFISPLPWSTCDNYWNTNDCVDITTRNLTNHTNGSSAATEFWERRVWNISSGIEEIGSIRWEVLLCLLAVWVVCYFCMWKGIKSTGKVVYITATFPYVMLLILLIRGLTLPGARQGVEFYLLPDPSRLTDPQVWLDAGSQIFFSYSLGVGTLTVLGSYNTRRNNCYKDCFWLCLLNSLTSVVAGFAVFSVLGFMAHKQGVPISEVAESGPGLAFVAYPQAVAMMPLPNLWSICFFVMLILLVLDTQFVGIEVVMTSFTDVFPTVMRRAGRHERFLLLFCLICFLLQLDMTTMGGMYIFQIFDYYACNGACLLFLCVFKSLAMGWIFGAERLCGIIEEMTGDRPNPFFKICWRYISPLVSVGTFIYYLIGYKPLTFNRSYVYPTWAYVLGWMMAVSSILLVPIWALYKLCTAKGTLSQRLHGLCWPQPPEGSLARNRETMLQHTTEEDKE